MTCHDDSIDEVLIGYTSNDTDYETAMRAMAPAYETICKHGGFERWTAEVISVHDCKNIAEAKRITKQYSKQLNKVVYRCEACDYECGSKFLWKQHCSTMKHTKRVGKASSKTPTECLTCLTCGKQYKHRSGLWRHRNSCGPDLKQIMQDMLSNDAKMKKEMMEQMKVQNQIIKDMIPQMGNNNNNRFNINVFLNEQCRDAINMSDFLASLQIKLNDLRYTKNHGLVEGVSSILLKGLRELDTYKRPIHCTDVKRETLYIKENNQWDRENGKEMLKTAILDVTHRQRRLISEWEKANPGWRDSESGKEEYIELVRTVMENMNDNKVIKCIAKETTVQTR
jgi:hypothetical protein